MEQVGTAQPELAWSGMQGLDAVDAEEPGCPRGAGPRQAHTGSATVFEWRQHYDSPELAAAIASFRDGLADIGARLAERFGGSVVENWSATG